jgi:hypothetical protein
MGELMRKKRGRPRKYAPDGSMALALAPISASAGGAAPHGQLEQQQQPHGFSISSPPSDPNAKRRGRPPGSGKKKQFEALGTSRSRLFNWPPRSKSHSPFGADGCFARAGSWGIAFTPHILPVKAGEVRKIHRSRFKTSCCINGGCKCGSASSCMSVRVRRLAKSLQR